MPEYEYIPEGHSLMIKSIKIRIETFRVLNMRISLKQSND